MELTDSTHPNPDPTRSVLVIDLNEVPSSSESPRLDALSVVRSFHDNLTPPDGGPAELPGGVSVCAACGLQVVQGNVLVCDGCELGFHLGCAEMRGQKEMVSGEWLCGKCLSSAVPCNRWPLGVKTEAKVNKRGNCGILDINALPSSDGEGEDLSVSRY